MRNVTCVYCGILLTKETSTKEHVVGRRFVPRGKLNNQWNLIVKACEQCNSEKADLEDDISAITMLPGYDGDGFNIDDQIAAEAHRKAQNAVSRRTQEKVFRSEEEVNINAKISAGVTFKFNFKSAPQIDEQRVYQLARMHIRAFFYWITFQEVEQKGRFWSDVFCGVATACRGDWGNPVLVTFSNMVIGWEPRVIAFTADGFFRVAVRKHPEKMCWSWALEWNHNRRVVGFCGDKATILELNKKLPKLELETLHSAPNELLQMRFETPLHDDEDDKLFFHPTLDETAD
ncbi:HNH endonuclease [Kordiimonas aestuarii]|uniref:HNH endonuclease n=1 Tax=Kordiimonas aestuarii TaxID=1005925 RepID=UPI0021D3A829|nr:HNH endonuclease [Kordiimonas aestuarii]